MKKNKVLALLQVESNAATIAEKAGCSTQYVYTLAKRNGIEVFQNNAGNLKRELFNYNTTLNEIAKNVGVSYSCVWKYMKKNNLPYKRDIKGTEYQKHESYVDKMVFLQRRYLLEILGIEHWQLAELRSVLAHAYSDYNTSYVGFSLGKKGVEVTAEELGLDEEVLENIMHVYKHSECPITGKTAHLTAALFNAIARGER